MNTMTPHELQGEKPYRVWESLSQSNSIQLLRTVFVRISVGNSWENILFTLLIGAGIVQSVLDNIQGKARVPYDIRVSVVPEASIIIHKLCCDKERSWKEEIEILQNKVSSMILRKAV